MTRNAGLVVLHGLAVLHGPDAAFLEAEIESKVEPWGTENPRARSTWVPEPGCGSIAECEARMLAFLEMVPADSLRPGHEAMLDGLRARTVSEGDLVAFARDEFDLRQNRRGEFGRMLHLTLRWEGWTFAGVFPDILIGKPGATGWRGARDPYDDPLRDAPRGYEGRRWDALRWKDVDVDAMKQEFADEARRDFREELVKDETISELRPGQAPFSGRMLGRYGSEERYLEAVMDRAPGSNFRAIVADDWIDEWTFIDRSAWNSALTPPGHRGAVLLDSAREKAISTFSKMLEQVPPDAVVAVIDYRT